MGLAKASLEDDRLVLWTEKLGTRVYVPLPPDAVEALGGIKKSGDYFFWTGNGLRRSAVADWQRSLRRVFAEASVKGNPHMFRHSFATNS